MFGVIQHTEEFEDVRMIAETLDLDLLKKLVNHEILLDHLLTDLFYGKHNSSLLMDSLIDHSEFSLT